MTRLKLSVMFGWLAATAYTTAQSTPAEAGKEFRLTARKYQFSPTTIRVKQGDRVKLIITAIDADHGFKLAESLEFAKKELEVRQDVYSWDILAWTYYKNGKSSEAAEAMSHALGRGTKDALFFFHAGMICDKAGDSAKARDYLQRVLETNPHFHILYSGTATETLARLAKKEDVVSQQEAPGAR